MMNNRKKVLIIAISIIAAIALTISCSKKRIDDKPLNEYKSINKYLDSKKQPEQEYIIDSGGKCPLIGKYGTKICPTKHDLQFADKTDSIHWPFTLKLIELYKVKDMIYYQMPSVSGGNIITTIGELRIRALKDNAELIFRPTGSWSVSMPSKDTLINMKGYIGNASSSIDWVQNADMLVLKTDTSYNTEDKKLGWMSCAKPANSNSSVSLTFKSETDKLDSIAIFVYVPSKRSLLQVKNLISGSIPAGSTIKIIAMAQNASDKLFYFYKEMVLGQNNEDVDITLKEISDSDLTAKLDAL